MTLCKAGCGKPPVRGGVFCSRSCAAGHNNRVSPKRAGALVKCQGCDVELKGAGRCFCSNACQQSHQRLQFIQAWKAGNVSGQVGMSISRHVRAYLVERCEGCCERCGCHSWRSAPVLLQVDHRDGDHTNCCEANLWMICPNCHAQQPTSGSRNRGRGRSDRLSYSKRTNVLVQKASGLIQFLPP